MSLNLQPDIQPKNKIQDVDLNNIKRAINESSNYIELEMPTTQLLDTTNETINFTFSFVGVMQKNDFIYVTFPNSEDIQNTNNGVSINGYPVILNESSIPYANLAGKRLQLVFNGEAFEIDLSFLNFICPIGGAVFNKNADFNPNDLYFGTTWENLGCCVLMGCDPNDSRYNSPGTYVGENEHILTIDELPNHGHEVNFAPPNGNPDDVNGSGLQYGTKNGSNTNVLVKNTGGNQPHNNVQRSYLGYWWIRTS